MASAPCLKTANPTKTSRSQISSARGLYGSVSIFQIDNYFIEVNIEQFTRGSPLEPLSRGAMRFFEDKRSEFEAAATADATDGA